MTNKPIRLVVFDFDGTTVDTGTPETHKPIYKEKTGEDWPHRGWWGRPESLNMEVFDFPAKAEVKEMYEEERTNPNAMVISLTGRRPKLGDKVKAILDVNGYEFDRYLYNYGADTLSNKLEQLGDILSEFPSIREVRLFDDRLEHFVSFNQWGEGLIKSGRLDEYELTEIDNPQWTK